MAETAHAAQLASEGLGKSDVRRRIFDLTLKPVKQFAGQLPKDTRGDELGSLLDGSDTLLPLAREPEDLDIIVAGAGAAGAHSLVMPSFGNTRTVSLYRSRILGHLVSGNHAAAPVLGESAWRTAAGVRWPWRSTSQGSL